MPRRPLAAALLMVLCTTTHAQGAPLPMSEDAARAADRVQGNLERIQGRTLGCLRIRVEAPASAFEQLLEQARQVADRAEQVSPGRNAPAAFPVAG